MHSANKRLVSTCQGQRLETQMSQFTPVREAALLGISYEGDLVPGIAYTEDGKLRSLVGDVEHPEAWQSQEAASTTYRDGCIRRNIVIRSQKPAARRGWTTAGGAIREGQKQKMEEEMENHPVFFFFPPSNLPSVLPQVESSPKPAAWKPGKWSSLQGRAAQGKEGKASESKRARGALGGVAPRRCPSGASSLTQAISAVQGRGGGSSSTDPSCATSVPGAFRREVDLLILNTTLHSRSIPTFHKRKLRLGRAGRVTARHGGGGEALGTASQSLGSCLHLPCLAPDIHYSLGKRDLFQMQTNLNPNLKGR